MRPITYLPFFLTQTLTQTGAKLYPRKWTRDFDPWPRSADTHLTHRVRSAAPVLRKGRSRHSYAAFAHGYPNEREEDPPPDAEIQAHLPHPKAESLPQIAAIHPNMVVKIPMTVEGLKACKVLSSEGIKTNVTLIFSANQALLAARAGATYVSPFLGRLDDISTRGVDLIRDIADIFAVTDLDTQIIAASVRNPIHVTDCALAGADIATVPYSVIEQMVKHPLTDAGIAKFQADYKAVFGE